MKNSEENKILIDNKNNEQTNKNLSEELINEKKQVDLYEDSILNKEQKDNISEDKKYKQLAFWVGLVCCVVVVSNIILNSFGVNFEIKLAVEIISYVLAFLVSLGVLKSTKQTKDVEQLKNEIQNEIMSSKNNKEKDLEEKNKK